MSQFDVKKITQQLIKKIESIGFGIEKFECPDNALCSSLINAVPFNLGVTILEHIYAVCPLLNDFFVETNKNRKEISDVLNGQCLVGLALFSPSPNFNWQNNAVSLEAIGNSYILNGEFRVICESLDKVILLGKSSINTYHLCLVPFSSCHKKPSQLSSQVSQAAMFNVQNIEISSDFVSKPISAMSDGKLNNSELNKILDQYSSQYVEMLLQYLKQGIHGVRTLIDKVKVASHSYHNSQQLAYELTNIEIEFELANKTFSAFLNGNSEMTECLLLSGVSELFIKFLQFKQRFEGQTHLSINNEIAHCCFEMPTIEQTYATLGGPCMAHNRLADQLGLPV